MTTRDTLKKLLGYGAGMASGAVGLMIGLATQLMLARHMGAANYGILTLTLTIVLLPVSLLDLGIINAMHRFISVRIGENRHGQIKTIVKQSALVLAAIALLMFLAFELLAPHLSRWFSIAALEKTVPLMALFVPMLYLQLWALTVMRGFGENALRITLEGTVFQICLAGFSFLLWRVTDPVSAVLFAQGLSYVLVAVLAMFFSRRKLAALTHDDDGAFDFREIIRHGFPMNIATMGQAIFRRGDTLVIGAMLGETAVGLYNAAAKLASGAKMLSAPINSYAGFFMSRSIGEKNMKNAVFFYDLAVLATMAFTLPVLFVLFTMAADIIPFLFKDEYRDAVPVLRILCAGFAVFVCTGPMAAFFNATGRNWVRMWLVLGIGIFNIILNVFLIRIMGLAGAATSTALSFALLYIAFAFFVKKEVMEAHVRISKAPLGLLLLFFGLAGGFNILPELALWLRGAAAFAGAAVIFIVSALVSWRFYLFAPKIKFNAHPPQSQ